MQNYRETEIKREVSKQQDPAFKHRKPKKETRYEEGIYSQHRKFHFI